MTTLYMSPFETTMSVELSLSSPLMVNLDRTVASQKHLNTLNNDTIPVALPNARSWAPSHAPSILLLNNWNESVDEVWVREVRLKLYFLSGMAR